MDITAIPTNELRQDLQDSLNDIKICQLAINHGIEAYSGGSVQHRLNENRRFVKVITAELARRETV